MVNFLYIINDAIDNRTLFMGVLLRDPHSNKKERHFPRKEDIKCTHVESKGSSPNFASNDQELLQ